MTKEAYLEMCEALGSEPLPEEMPVEADDLANEVQLAMKIYNTSLRDEWDYMAGNYIGKNFNNLFDIFSLYEIDRRDYLFMYNILIQIDAVRSKIEKEKKANEKTSK